MDFADLLQSNIELNKKEIDMIIDYTYKQKDYSIYATKLNMIGHIAIKNYLKNNEDFKKIILKEIRQRKILIKLYKQKIKEYSDDPIKLNILHFGLELIEKNIYDFQNKHKNIFKKNLYIINT